MYRLSSLLLVLCPLCAQPQAGDVLVNPKDGLLYAYVPAGMFRMGCASAADDPCDENEKPAHVVQISKGFWMGQTEVTVAAYRRYVQSGGKERSPHWAGDAHPMTGVDWYDARDYCGWAGMRLPTEAEWEYAARGGTAGAQYAALDEIAWYAANSGEEARPVAQKAANRYKLYDMLGNVWEWTADRFKDRYEDDGVARDPQGPPVGEYRLLRGGSWGSTARVVRASVRYRNQPTLQYGGSGFRCAGERSVPE
jgi:formylglycine-generating enzyme required for sulfatase activity